MRTGRPSKRTPEVEAHIIEGLQKGYTKAAAAGAAGIGYSTLNEWEHAFPEFAEAVQKAEGRAKARLIDKVNAAKSWQASAWMLERRWPAEFARRESLEMTGKDGGPIEHRSVSDLPDHEKQALADAIQNHLREQDAATAEAAPAGDRQD
jgi:hypothetical protein